MSEKEKCPDCGKKYERVGHHWTMSSSCSYPNYTEKQKQIITGLLMGDASVTVSENRKPMLSIDTITPKYLNYISKQFGILSGEITKTLTAKENAQRLRNSGFSKNAKEENYSDVYSLRLKRHPELKEFRNWYSTGKKIWPEDIELTPTVLKHWYCCDGCWKNKGNANNIQISISDQFEYKEKINDYFISSNLPKPSSYTSWERKDGSIKGDITWTTEQSKKLWQYMGEPLPDFEYKWPERYH